MDPRKLLKKIKKDPSVSQSNFYFALKIEKNLVKGAVWSIQGQKAFFCAASDEIGYQKETDILEVSDQALSQAVEKSSPSKEPDQVILGLPYSWVEGEKISPSYLKLIKDILRELEIKPIGFVVNLEAVIQYLKLTEGVPPNAILLKICDQKMEVALAKLGKIIAQEEVVRSPDLGADLAEGLSRFKNNEVLPARILFIANDPQDIQKAKEQILSFPWLEKQDELGLNFLHLPKLEIAPPDFLVKAVALAGGGEALGISQLEVQESFSNQPQSAQPAFSVVLETPSPHPDPPSPLPSLRPKPFAPPDSEPVTSPPLSSPSELKFGFTDKTSSPGNFLSDSPDPPPPPPVKKSSSPIRFGRLFQFFPDFFRKITPKIPPISLPRPRVLFSSSLFPKTIFFTGLFLFFLAALAGLGFYFLPRAEINLFLKKEFQEKNFFLTLDSEIKELDLNQGIVPGQKISLALADTQALKTTGSKIVGEKASGSVTIYNRTSQSKDLPSGTIFQSASDLQFTLTEDLRVASESSGPDYSRLPGKATAKLTAVAIGTESNLAQGTEFTIGKYSQTDLIARSDELFTGGSSREVQAVSEKDRENLLQQALETLTARALPELTAGLNSGQEIVKDSLASEITKESFSASAGQESQELSLTLEVSFSALSYRYEDFDKVISQEVEKTLPAGFEFVKDESLSNFKLQESNSQKALFQVQYKAAIYPRLDIAKLSQHLKGKKASFAGLYLENLPEVDSFSLSFKPNLPPNFQFIPHRLGNITINLEY